MTLLIKKEGERKRVLNRILKSNVMRGKRKKRSRWPRRKNKKNKWRKTQKKNEIKKEEETD